MNTPSIGTCPSPVVAFNQGGHIQNDCQTSVVATVASEQLTHLGRSWNSGSSASPDGPKRKITQASQESNIFTTAKKLRLVCPGRSTPSDFHFNPCPQGNASSYQDFIKNPELLRAELHQLKSLPLEKVHLTPLFSATIAKLTEIFEPLTVELKDKLNGIQTKLDYSMLNNFINNMGDLKEKIAYDLLLLLSDPPNGIKDLDDLRGEILWKIVLSQVLIFSDPREFYNAVVTEPDEDFSTFSRADFPILLRLALLGQWEAAQGIDQLIPQKYEADAFIALATKNAPPEIQSSERYRESLLKSLDGSWEKSGHLGIKKIDENDFRKLDDAVQKFFKDKEVIGVLSNFIPTGSAR